MENLESYSAFLAAHAEYLYRLEHNTFVAESMGLVYMDTPKTAGTSIKTRLAQIESGYVAPKDSLSLETVSEMFIHDRAVNPLKPVTAYPESAQQEMLFSSRWKRFCVVRNPYTRLFSAWFSKVLLRQPGYIDALANYQLPEKISEIEDIYLYFENFVIHLDQYGCDSDPHWDLQTRLLFHNDIEWGYIFRFEYLQEQLSEKEEYFGGKGMELGKLNVSGFSPDWTAISGETIKLIQSIYGPDFEAYEYPTSPPESRIAGNSLLEYINAVAGRNMRIQTLLRNNEQQRIDLERLRQDCDCLGKKLNDSETGNARLSRELDDLVNSRSWKITAPMRKLLKLLPAR